MKTSTFTSFTKYFLVHSLQMKVCIPENVCCPSACKKNIGTVFYVDIISLFIIYILLSFKIK